MAERSYTPLPPTSPTRARGGVTGDAPRQSGGARSIASETRPARPERVARRLAVDERVAPARAPRRRSRRARARASLPPAPGPAGARCGARRRRAGQPRGLHGRARPCRPSSRRRRRRRAACASARTRPARRSGWRRSRPRTRSARGRCRAAASAPACPPRGSRATGLPTQADTIWRSWIIRSRTTSTSRPRGVNTPSRCASMKSGARHRAERRVDRRVVPLDVADREDAAAAARERDELVGLGRPWRRSASRRARRSPRSRKNVASSACVLVGVAMTTASAASATLLGIREDAQPLRARRPAPPGLRGGRGRRPAWRRACRAATRAWWRPR